MGTPVLIFVIVLVIVVGFVVVNTLGGWLNWYGGSAFPLSDLPSEIEWSMKYGCHKAIARIDNRRNGNGYVDFLKQNPNRERGHFDMIVSERACSAMEFEAIGGLLEHEGVAHSVDVSSDGRHIVVSCDRDIDLGVRACKLILTQIWKVRPDAVLRLRCKGHFIAPIRRTGPPEWNDID